MKQRLDFNVSKEPKVYYEISKETTEEMLAGMDEFKVTHRDSRLTEEISHKDSGMKMVTQHLHVDNIVETLRGVQGHTLYVARDCDGPWIREVESQFGSVEFFKPQREVEPSKATRETFKWKT